MKYIVRWDLVLPSRFEDVEDAASKFEEGLRSAGWSDEEIGNLPVAFREAIVNGMIHGNRMNREKKIRFRGEADQVRVEVVVTDEGEGFDPDAVPDPTDESCLLKRNGRGVHLMRQIFDSAVWNKKGNEVRLIKNR